MIKHSKKAMNMLKKFPKVYVLTIIFLFTTLSVSAGTSNSLIQKQLIDGVTRYVNQTVNPNNSEHIKVKTIPLDNRIRVNQCQVPLEFEMMNRRKFTRQFPVKVSCNATGAYWKMFVQVRVTEYIEALVTTKSVGKGELITEDHITLSLIEKRNVDTGNAISTDAVIGGRAIRNLHRGFQIGANDVCLVCKGDSISIVAQSSNMMIKTNGTAIESGSFGESIKVKNNSSDRIVKGTVGELRQVYVNL